MAEECTPKHDQKNTYWTIAYSHNAVPILRFIHHVQCGEGHATSLFRKECCSNIKYKFTYFRCFPSNMSILVNLMINVLYSKAAGKAFIVSRSAQATHCFLVVEVHSENKSTNMHE